MEKVFAIIQNGKVLNNKIFKSKEQGQKNLDQIEKQKGISYSVEEVWEFLLWFRWHDNKDFLQFYSANKNIDDAISEALEFEKTQILSFFSIDLIGFGSIFKSGQKVYNQNVDNFKNETLC